MAPGIQYCIGFAIPQHSLFKKNSLNNQIKLLFCLNLELYVQISFIGEHLAALKETGFVSFYQKFLRKTHDGDVTSGKRVCLASQVES